MKLLYCFATVFSIGGAYTAYIRPGSEWVDVAWPIISLVYIWTSFIYYSLYRKEVRKRFTEELVLAS